MLRLVEGGGVLRGVLRGGVVGVMEKILIVTVGVGWERVGLSTSMLRCALATGAVMRLHGMMLEVLLNSGREGALNAFGAVIGALFFKGLCRCFPIDPFLCKRDVFLGFHNGVAVEPNGIECIA